VPGADEDSWNTQAVARGAATTGAQCWSNGPGASAGWSRCRAVAISGLAGLAGKTLAPRQPEAGSQILLDRLLASAGIGRGAVQLSATAARSETDAVLMVQEGKADCCFGLASIAAQFKLGFVPLARERFDLLVDRKAWFDPPLQALLAFCRSPMHLPPAQQKWPATM
jgi:putative molybdopterin biosynthesis protein